MKNKNKQPNKTMLVKKNPQAREGEATPPQTSKTIKRALSMIVSRCVRDNFPPSHPRSSPSLVTQTAK
jgi:hypothetical protein